MGGKSPLHLNKEPLKNLKYLDTNVLKQMTIFAPDMDEVEVEGNKLSTHRLIKYYNEGWEKWYE